MARWVTGVPTSTSTSRRHARQRAQVRRQLDSNHGSVSTSTENTAGRSRTIGAQVSPPSREA